MKETESKEWSHGAALASPVDHLVGRVGRLLPGEVLDHWMQ